MTVEADSDGTSFSDIARNVLVFIRTNARPILISLGFSLIVSLIITHFVPLKYQAAVMVSPQEGLSPTGSLGGLQGLASLASSSGASSLGDGVPFQPFLRFTQTITNDSVAQAIMKQPWVMPAMFPEQWDDKTRSWHPKYGPIAAIREAANFVLGLRPWHPPDAQDLQILLDKRVDVQKYGRNPAYTITFMDRDPENAAKMLSLLLSTNDAIIHSDARTRAAHMIDYLQGRLRDESMVNRRNVLDQLMLEQERALMASQAGGDYAAKTIDALTVTPSLIQKLIAFGISFPILALACFFGLRISRRLRQGESFRGAVRMQAGR